MKRSDAWALLAKAAKVGLAVVPYVPTKEDGYLHMVTKCVAMYQAGREALEEGKINPIQELADKHGLASMTSEPFVSLFFNTDLGHSMEKRKFTVDRDAEVMFAKGHMGELMFEFPSWLRGKAKDQFFHSKDFDPVAAVGEVWAAFEGRMAVEIVSSDWDTKTSYSSFPKTEGPMYGKAPRLLADVIARHRRFEVDGIARSYGFFGPPGAGKTTFADRFADTIGTRTLRIGAESFSNVKGKDLAFVLDMLEPDFLIVDDADKATGSSAAKLLSMMEHYKLRHPKTTLVLTANGTSGFDQGLLRPGRVDEWLGFDIPDDDERREVLECMGAPHIDELVEVTKGLTHDYLRDVAQLAKREDLATVLALTEARRKLVVEDDDGDSEDE